MDTKSIISYLLTHVCVELWNERSGRNLKPYVKLFNVVKAVVSLQGQLILTYQYHTTCPESGLMGVYVLPFL